RTLKMTRKTALKKAIAILSEDKNNPEICEKLRELHDELPLIHWSEKSIRDRVEQFIEEEHRIPKVSDFRKAGMPPHPVFKQKFGITLGEWLSRNYPSEKLTYEDRKEQITKEFKENYNTIKPESQEQFNRQRKAGTKSWQTVAKYHGVSTWHGLLKELGLPAYSKPQGDREKAKITVNIFHDLKR
ncbi:MAG: hypothetical protein ACI4GY_11050, partial [Acutalibacteraceae bacterium]